MKSVTAVCAAVLTCLSFEVLSLTPVEYVDEEYRSILNSTAYHVWHAILKQSERIGITIENIEETVEESQESVEEALEELKESISDEVEDAEDDGFDLTACVNETYATIIDKGIIDNSFQGCKKPIQIEKLLNQKLTLGKLGTRLAESINDCVIKQKETNGELNPSLDIIISRFEKRIEMISSGIGILIKRALEASFICAYNAKNKLDGQIYDSATKFENCVKNVLGAD